MNNPEYVKIGDKKYKINTDYKVALKCNNIANDETIGDLERALALIYTLYGDEGINNPQDYEKLLELAKKYLSCGDDGIVNKKNNDDEQDMDYDEDMAYIIASFMSDYHIDLTKTDMHWWTFYSLINGLSNSEFGNCCILNRIRNLRRRDISKIQDSKERQEVAEAQEMVALKKHKKNHIVLTDEQEESMERLNKIIGLGKE